MLSSIAAEHSFIFCVSRIGYALRKLCIYLEIFMNIINTFTSRFLASAAMALAALALLPGCASTPAEPAQQVRILEPANNATVGTTFKVRFGVKGLEVAPAGDIVANSGHHHLLINLDAIAPGESIPFTERHMHFGKGQTEAEIKLAPGVYKLTAQFANGAHQSYGKALSETITVTVK
jgi:Domain of unknown function (DUF4399)